MKQRKKHKQNQISKSNGCCDKTVKPQDDLTATKQTTASRSTKQQQQQDDHCDILSRLLETKPALFRGFLALASVIIHLNSLKCGFVYDDRRAILENRNVVQLNSDNWLSRLLGDDFWGNPMSNPGSHKSYRPIVTLSFRLQVWLEQQWMASFARLSEPVSDDTNNNQVDVPNSMRLPSAAPMHLVNVILHLLVVDAIFRLVSRQFQSRPLALWTCLLFVCHPIHVEAVTSLVGRADLMGALLVLLSFEAMLAHLQSSQTDKQLIKCTLLALLAPICKETGACVIGINLLLIGMSKTASRRTKITSSVAMLAVAVAFVGLRVQLNAPGRLMPTFSHLDNPLAQSSIQFCRRISNLRELSAFGQLPSETSKTNGSQTLDPCESGFVLNSIGHQLALTRLYLAAFSFKLLALPVRQSYDWPLASIRLVKSPFELRFMAALALYLLGGHIALKWILSELAKRFSESKYNNNNNNKSINHCAGEESSSESETGSVKSGDSGFAGDSLDRPPSRASRHVGPKKGHPAPSEPTTDNQLGWALTWLVVPYLPASNLLIPVGFLVAERTLYLPSFGFCLLAAHLFDHLRMSKLTRSFKIKIPLVGPSTEKKCKTTGDMTKLVLVCPLLIWLAAKCVERNGHWLDERSLYTSNLHESPAKSMANLASLSDLTRHEHKHEELEQIYKTALELEPNSADLHYNIALFYQTHPESHKFVQQVEYHYKFALKLRNNFALAALNLGAHQFTVMRQRGQALRSYESCAFHMDPTRSKSSNQHVRAQIECLISGAKLLMATPDSEQTTSASPNTKQTSQPAVAGDVDSRQRQKPMLETAFEWLELAQSKVGPNLNLASALDADDDDDDSLGGHQRRMTTDPNKQLATIHWLKSKCVHNSDESLFRQELGSAVDLIERQVSSGKLLDTLAVSIYVDYADFLVKESSSKTGAIRMLKQVIQHQQRTRKKSKHLIWIHKKLASLVDSKDEALEQVEAALKLAPSDANLLSEAGQIAYEARKLSESEQFYHKALLVSSELDQSSGRNKRLASAHVNYGAILQLVGRRQDALLHYRQALDCDPSNVAAGKNLARLAQ